MLGPLIGGAITQYASSSWRWCFYINLPPGGLVALLLVLIKIPSASLAEDLALPFWAKLRSMDLIGFAIFAPATIQLFLALQWGGTSYPWRSATIIGLFCGAAGTLCLFFAWTWREGDKAMLPLSVLRRRTVWCSFIVIGVLFASVSLVAYYLPIYFQVVKGASPTNSGVYMLPVILSALFVGILAGFLGMHRRLTLPGISLDISKQMLTKV